MEDIDLGLLSELGKRMDFVRTVSEDRVLGAAISSSSQEEVDAAQEANGQKFIVLTSKTCNIHG